MRAHWEKNKNISMQKSAAFDGLNALVQNIVIKESDNDNNNVSSAKSIP